MFRKMLLATSALVIASSMALAAVQHGKLSPAQQLERAKLVTRYAITKHMPGAIFGSKGGAPIAVIFQMSAAKAGAEGKEARSVPGGKGFNNFSKSKNALFLSWFGYVAGSVNASYNSSNSFCISYNSTYTQCLNHEDVHNSSQIALAESFAQPFTHVSGASTISFGAEQYSGAGGARVAIHKDASGLPGAKVAGASGTFSGLPSFNGLCCAGLTTVTFPRVSLHKERQYFIVMSPNKNANGRIIWNGQDSNWNIQGPGEYYNSLEHVKYKDTYRTTRSGHQSTYSGSRTSGTGGWVHTSHFTFGGEAAFAIN